MIIYTDGSAHPNPGPGGFGVVLLNDNEQLINTYSEQCADTTNNREELKAILWTILKYGKPAAAHSPLTLSGYSEHLTIYTDSAYCLNTLTNWMYTWKKNGWKKADNNTPENLDLIKVFYTLYERGYEFNLIKVKGHSNNIWNEMADKLATGKKV